MKSPDSVTYLKRNSLINTNIEKLVKGNFSPSSKKTDYGVDVTQGGTRNTKAIFKMIMGVAYFISLAYFLTELLT